jgi:uncharacterized protein YoxC
MNPTLSQNSSALSIADPVFWLGCSLLLVAMSLTAVFVVAIPVVQELARAARSAEKLLDTLNRELPATLEAIRLTGSDLGDLQKDVNRGVKSAVSVVEQVDRSFTVTKQQVDRAQITTKSWIVGTRAAIKAFRNYGKSEKD